MLSEILDQIRAGAINADDAAYDLDISGIDVTDTIYEQLRYAEIAYYKSKCGLQVGDIILVMGKNGNPNFEANYRGTFDGKYVVVVNGNQFTIDKSDKIN